MLVEHVIPGSQAPPKRHPGSQLNVTSQSVFRLPKQHRTCYRWIWRSRGSLWNPGSEVNDYFFPLSRLPVFEQQPDKNASLLLLSCLLGKKANYGKPRVSLKLSLHIRMKITHFVIDNKIIEDNHIPCFYLWLDTSYKPCSITLPQMMWLDYKC